MAVTYEALMADIAQQVEQKKLPPLLQREFVEVNDCTKVTGEVIRIHQWNMLAQGLSFCRDNFVLCPVEALDLETRQLRILEEIIRYRPTIMCIEEVDLFQFLLEKLSPIGYLGVFFPKPDSPCLYEENNQGSDGCAIFYDTKKIRMSWSNNIILKLENKHNSNQVAIISEFQTKTDDPKQFIVAVTHLKSKKGYAGIRDQQAKYLIKTISETCNDLPVIICGDFNADPTEPAYEVVKSCDLDLSSVYTTLSSEKSEPPYTTWKTRPKGEVKHTIDYIWTSNKGLKVKSVLEIPSEEEVGKNGLPSMRYPSDHLSLVCDVIVQSKEE